MKKTKRREVGIGDNLYGIPLDDILSPQQVSELREDTIVAVKKDRKKRRKKREQKRNEFKIPKFRLSTNAMYTVVASILVIVLLFIFKNPLSAMIIPKTYVSDAFKNTVSQMTEESEKTVKAILGFDLFDKKEMTFAVESNVLSDAYGNKENLSINGQMGYSKKSNTASALWQYAHDGDEFSSGSLYLNDDQVGFSMPELFGEYWVAPAKEFGSKWNQSGLRKALYAGALGEEADLSFSNVFSKKSIFSADGMKEAKKLTDTLISSADAKHLGKVEIDVNGKIKKGRKFKYTFNAEQVKNYAVALLTLAKNDSEFVSHISSAGVFDKTVSDIDDLCARLNGTISINEATIELVEHKGILLLTNVRILYTENNMQSNIEFKFTAADHKRITNDMMFLLTSKGGKEYSYSLKTSGNHMANGNVFEDTTTVKVVDNANSFVAENIMKFDYKEKTANGSFTFVKGANTKKVAYSGACSKKSGFTLDLNDVKISQTGEKAEDISCNVLFTAKTGMKLGKLNTANKKEILELGKTEAENYIKKLEETDSVKNYLKKMEEIFGKPEDVAH